MMNSSSTILPTTEGAVHMNLRGVQHMEANRYPQAIHEFSRALSTVKTVLALQQDGGDCMSMGAECQKLVFEFEDEDDEAMMKVDQDGGPFIFRSPIVVGYAFGASPQDPDDFSSLVKFSSSILFNLALTYHLAATGMSLSDPAKMKKLLQKALTFYKLTYTMMQDTQNNGVMETMAIANNLGHVQLSVGDAEKAKQCYEHLLSTIMFVTASGDDNRDSIQQFDGFFHSVQTVVLAGHHQTAEAA